MSDMNNLTHTQRSILVRIEDLAVGHARLCFIGRSFLDCPLVVGLERNAKGGWTATDSEGGTIEGLPGSLTSVREREIA